MVIKKSVNKKVVKLNKKFLVPIVLIIIGLIIGFIFGLLNVINKDRIGLKFSQILGYPADTLSIWFLIAGLIGMAISVIILMILFRVNKSPNKKDFKIICILTIIGFFTSMGIGAIIALIGAIIGIVKLRKIA